MPFLCAAALVAFSATAGAAQRALVLGSYQNADYAEERRARLARELGADVVIVDADVNGSVRYRVLLIADSDQDLAAKRRLTADAGISDAWVTTLPDRIEAGGQPEPVPIVSPTVVAVPQAQAPITQPAEPMQTEPTQAEPVRSEPVRSEPVRSEPVQPEPVPVSDPIGVVRLSSVGTDVDITMPQLAEGEFALELDGRLDEAFWQRIPGYDNLTITDPDTMEQPRYATDMRWFYTDKGMYIGVHMQQPPDTLLPRLSSRDQFLNRDSWGITLDTSGEGLYGYWFTVNLGGSVMDGKIAAERQYSNEWDGPWESATAEVADGWSTEMFLPWSMMTMPDSDGGARNFGFYVNRKVAYLDERWSWPALPFQSPAFMSVLATMQAPGVEPRRQLEIYPAVSHTVDEIDGSSESRAGADISWRPSSNIQVTATLNPDFGVVESDDVVVNLTAFETFFPEKRLFFLEGREVFQTTPRSRVRGRGPSGTGSRQTTSTFNPEPTTLLNTRRIGGPPRITVPDGVSVAGVERGKPSDLLGAVKVTGQSGPFRYGLLTAFEDDVSLAGVIDEGPDTGQPINVDGDGRDFGVARLLWESTGAGRTSFGYLGTMVNYTDSDAIVHGLDGHWLTPNGLWQIDGQLINSDVDDVTGSGVMTDISFKPKQGHQHNLTLDYFEDTLNVRDLGFIRRNDAQNITYRYSYSTGRDLKRLRSKSVSTILSNEWNMDGRLVRSGYFLRNAWTFKNLNEIRTEFDYFPAKWDDRNSFGNGDFKVEDRIVGEIAFGTDTAKPLSFSALVGMRQEELSGWTIRTGLGLTYKPNDRFSLDLDLNYFERDGWLLHQFAYGRSDPALDRNMTTFDAQDFQPRVAMDVFLTSKQQIRMTLQWAGITADEKDFYLIPVDEGDLIPVARAPGDTLNDFTVSRLTAQLRYRWEIGPLSDLFVVYTRGSNLPDRVDDEFSNLFRDAIDTPIVDLYVVKLRYRFGL